MAKVPHAIQKSPKSSAQRKAERPSKVTVTRPPKVKAALDPKAKLRPKQRAATLSEGVGAGVGAVPAAKPELPKKPEKLHPQLREYNVTNSTYKLLGPKKGIEPVDLTLEARAQIARRCLELRDKLPHAVDKEALARAADEAEKRAAYRKQESEERIRKLRERQGAANDDQPGTRKSPTQGGTMATEAKKAKTKPAPKAALKAKAPSAGTVKSRMAGLPPYTETTKITWLVKENPRRPGTETHANWKRYFGAGTVGELFKRGGFPGQLRWDLRHKYLKLG